MHIETARSLEAAASARLDAIIASGRMDTPAYRAASIAYEVARAGIVAALRIAELMPSSATA